MKEKLIVAIDDEPDILELLRYNFSREGFNIETFEKGKQGLEFIISNKPDAVVCDWMLPDIDGIEICKFIKNNHNLTDVSFVMLTAKSDEIDAVLALEMGADDFVSKPVRIKELISRIKKKLNNKKVTENNLNDPAIKPLKFTENSSLSTDKTKEGLFFKNIKVNIEKYKAYIDDKELDLTYSEFKLLHLFVKKPGKVFTRNQIIEKLNGMDYIVTERSIDVQIVGLRKKMGNYRDILETVRGVGYRLQE